MISDISTPWSISSGLISIRGTAVISENTRVASSENARSLKVLALSSFMIMAITGHKKESTFLKYIRITNEEAVKIITMSYKKKVS